MKGSANPLVAEQNSHKDESIMVTTSFARTILIALLVTCLVVALHSSASVAGAEQGADLTLASLRISVWPEYDQPSVLVIYEATVAEGTELPRTIQVLIPEDATVNAVAFPDATGGLFSLPWKSSNSDLGQVISFEIQVPDFVVEYYADVISPPPDRRFELSLVIPYDAQDVVLAFRQPARANDLNLVPRLDMAGEDSLGNPQFIRSLGQREAGEVIRFLAQYTKPDAEPTLARQSAVELPAADLSEPSGFPEWQPWVFGGLIGFLLGAGLATLAMSWQQSRRLAAVRRPEPATGRGRAARRRRDAAETSQSKFCVRCGHPFGVGDRFCRQCGASR